MNGSCLTIHVAYLSFVKFAAVKNKAKCHNRLFPLRKLPFMPLPF